MSILLIPLIQVLYLIISFYMTVIIVAVIFDWLKVFGILDFRNKYVVLIGLTLSRLTEPALRKIRRFVPLLGNIDISPVVLILILIFIQKVLAQIALKFS